MMIGIQLKGGRYKIMLVKKITCPDCGGHKVNELTTAYIYCDYCGALMGYDIGMLKKESKEIFSPKNMQRPANQKFIQISQKLNGVIQQKDADSFLALQLEMHEVEFEIYNNRFSPKVKQPAYRKNYLDFYRLYWRERLDNGYFEKSAEIQQVFKDCSEKISTEYVDGTYRATFDQAFVEYLDQIRRFTMSSVDETMSMECIAYYPEGNTSASRDIFYKQALSAAILQYDDDTVKKSLEHLGLQDEFIEIDPPGMSEAGCVVCGAALTVPAEANQVVCERCGSFNALKTGKTRCFGCGADFSPAEGDACEYCGAKIMRVGAPRAGKIDGPARTGPTGSADEKTEPPPGKKGFFKKLFG